MGLRELAEGILLQSIEDLSDQQLRGESIAFFRSDEFSICAELAAIDVAGQVKLLNMVKSVVELESRNSRIRRPMQKKSPKRVRDFQLVSSPPS